MVDFLKSNIHSVAIANLGVIFVKGFLIINHSNLNLFWGQNGKLLLNDEIKMLTQIANVFLLKSI